MQSTCPTFTFSSQVHTLGNDVLKFQIWWHSSFCNWCSHKLLNVCSDDVNTRDLEHILTEILKCANSGERDTVQTMSHNIQLYRGTLNVIETPLTTFCHSTLSQPVYLFARICKYYVCLAGNEILWVMSWTLIRPRFLTYESHSSVIFNTFL